MKKALMAVVIAALGFVLVGCPGTYDYYRVMERNGMIRFDPPDDNSYDYKVFVKNEHDPGWNGDIRADREKAIRQLLKGTCANIKVIDENPLHIGKYIDGRDAITYVMKVKCVK